MSEEKHMTLAERKHADLERRSKSAIQEMVQEAKQIRENKG